MRRPSAAWGGLLPPESTTGRCTAIGPGGSEPARAGGGSLRLGSGSVVASAACGGWLDALRAVAGPATSGSVLVRDGGSLRALLGGAGFDLRRGCSCLRGSTYATIAAAIV